MKTLRFLALLALAAMPMIGRAQITYDNLTSYGGNVSLSASSAIQTFTGLSSLQSVTWMMTNVSGTASSSTTFNTYLVEWTNPTATASTFQAIETGVVLTNLAQNFATTLEFTASSTIVLNPSTTYAIILTDTTGSTPFAVTTTANAGGAFFGSGGAGTAGFSLASSITEAGFQSALELFGTGGGTAINNSFSYSMAVVDATPAPEPKTAAAAIAVVFVMGLVGRREWQRRQLVPVPVSA